MCALFFVVNSMYPFEKHIRIPSMFLMRYIPGLFSFVFLFFFTCNWKPLVLVSYSLAVYFQINFLDML